MKKYFYTFLFFVYLTLGISSSSFAQDAETPGLKVKPTQIEVSTDPGNTISGELLIENISGNDLEFTVYSQDIINTLEGTTYGLLDKSDPHSMARWITFNESKYSIEKGTSIKVPYTINAPTGIRSGSYWGIVFLETRIIDQRGEKNLTVSSRVGIKTLIKIQPVKKIEISDIKVIQNILRYKGINISLKLRNIGSVPVQPNGNLKVYEDGNTDNIGFSAEVINPGEEREIGQTFKPTKFFTKYFIVASISGMNINSQAVDFLLYPYFIFLFAAFIVLIVIVSYCFYRKNRGKKKQGS